MSFARSTGLEVRVVSCHCLSMSCSLPRAAEVVRQNPGVRFMVDHCGLPYQRDDGTMKTWREGKTVHAKCWNAIKNSAVVPRQVCVLIIVFA